MGKYATYRMRGRGTPAGRGVGPPPCPQLEVAEDELLQTSNDTEWQGALLTLYSSPDGLAQWDLYDQAGAEAVYSWGRADLLPDAYYRATETGNGIDYIGESAPSAIIPIFNG